MLRWALAPDAPTVPYLDVNVRWERGQTCAGAGQNPDSPPEPPGSEPSARAARRVRYRPLHGRPCDHPDTESNDGPDVEAVAAGKELLQPEPVTQRGELTGLREEAEALGRAWARVAAARLENVTGIEELARAARELAERRRSLARSMVSGPGRAQSGAGEEALPRLQLLFPGAFTGSALEWRRQV
jgi:hypothetical protein